MTFTCTRAHTHFNPICVCQSSAQVSRRHLREKNLPAKHWTLDPTVTCSQWGGGWDPRSSRRPIRFQLKLSRPMAAKFQLLAEPRGKSSPLYPVTYVQHRRRGSACDPTHAQCSLGNKTIWKRRQDPQKRAAGIRHTHTHREEDEKKKRGHCAQLPRDKVFYLFSSVTMRTVWKKKKKSVARNITAFTAVKGPMDGRRPALSWVIFLLDLRNCAPYLTLRVL